MHNVNFRSKYKEGCNIDIASGIIVGDIASGIIVGNIAYWRFISLVNKWIKDICFIRGWFRNGTICGNILFLSRGRWGWSNAHVIVTSLHLAYSA